MPDLSAASAVEKNGQITLDAPPQGNRYPGQRVTREYKYTGRSTRLTSGTRYEMIDAPGILADVFVLGRPAFTFAAARLLFPPEPVGDELPQARFLLNRFGGQFCRTQGYLHHLDLPPAVVMNVLHGPVLDLLAGRGKRPPRPNVALSRGRVLRIRRLRLLLKEPSALFGASDFPDLGEGFASASPSLSLLLSGDALPKSLQRKPPLRTPPASMPVRLPLLWLSISSSEPLLRSSSTVMLTGRGIQPLWRTLGITSGGAAGRWATTVLRPSTALNSAFLLRLGWLPSKGCWLRVSGGTGPGPASMHTLLGLLRRRSSSS
ncbi:hypothetical protein EYF80_054736 [Liparis tanakae]|uniref:Uncharacterized protein n=1 Tax=Liparis tanakae TaxID=230148 RepID=A0A4Z2F3N3_9TELE|nr:hypothetical protein EYF80_054736 [Liparis tanakae]